MKQNLNVEIDVDKLILLEMIKFEKTCDMEIKTDIITSKIVERIKNPLISSYFFSFIILNWKPIYILLFSKLPAEKRLELVYFKYEHTCKLFLPFAGVYIYLYVVPWIKNKINKSLEDIKAEEINLKYRLRVMDIEGQKDIAKAERELQEEIAGTNEIGDLNETISDLSKNLDIEKKASESYKKSLEESKLINEELDKRNKDLIHDYAIIQSSLSSEKELHNNEIKNIEKKLMLYICSSKKADKEIVGNAIEKTDQNQKKLFLELGNNLSKKMYTNDELKFISEFENLGLLLKKSYGDNNYNFSNNGIAFLDYLNITKSWF